MDGEIVLSEQLMTGVVEATAAFNSRVNWNILSFIDTKRLSHVQFIDEMLNIE